MPTIPKFIVAVHGIGDQRRKATVRSVAAQFGELQKPALASDPLGYYDLGSGTSVTVRDITLQSGDVLGFAEVYWADIPRAISLRNDTLDETKYWGRTVASRAQETYRAARGTKNTPGFEQVPAVIDEFVEGVGVIENLLRIAAKAGLLKLELEPLLSDYVGGVQLVADFEAERLRIIDRFHEAMKIVFNYANGKCDGHPPEIYIVAHSEGTVISFAGLLQALLQPPASSQPADAGDDHEWIASVRGFMTFGSPIDKHLLLFPNMWPQLGLPPYSAQTVRTTGDAAVKWRSTGEIIWHNYYDYGDPIGFELDTAREYLTNIGCSPLKFLPENDYGFSRYPLPGAAHTGYWKDSEVFRRFIYEVVLTNPQKRAEKPRTKVCARILSWVIPYGAALIIQLLAAFVLLKPFSDKVCELELHVFAPIALGFGLLYAGATVAMRLPRIVARGEKRWWITAAIAFVIGAFACLSLYRANDCLWSPFELANGSIPAVPATLIGAMLCIVVLSWIVRWAPSIGRRLQLAFGSAVFFFVIGYSAHSDWSKSPPHSLTQVALGAVAFVYLWWLVIVLFDLTFVWHRYIRRSVALDALRQWHHGKTGPLPLRKDRPGKH